VGRGGVPTASAGLAEWFHRKSRNSGAQPSWNFEPGPKNAASCTGEVQVARQTEDILVRMVFDSSKWLHRMLLTPGEAELRIGCGVSHCAAGLSDWFEGLADWFVRK